MKAILMVAAALAVAGLGGCAVYAPGYPPGSYWYYEDWGYEGGGQGRHGRGGRSEPGNESGMYPARPSDGRGGHGGGGSRGGEAGMK